MSSLLQYLLPLWVVGLFNWYGIISFNNMYAYSLQEVSIPVLDYFLAGDIYSVPDSKSVLMFFPGYGSDKERNRPFLDKLVKTTGLSVVCVNLSGHGKSPIFQLDDTRPLQHIIEAAILYEWTEGYYGKLPIAIMGNSYGGYIAAQLCTYKNVRALILRAPAIYPTEVLVLKQRDIDRCTISHVYRRDSRKLKNNPLFNELSKINNFPSLIMIHGDDEDIPKETTDMYKGSLRLSSSYFGAGIRHSFGSPENNKESVSQYLNFLYKWIIENIND